jgi:outer membrane protein assembly factor BamE (lipoprotein component of BamABCDE complex)
MMRTTRDTIRVVIVVAAVLAWSLVGLAIVSCLLTDTVYSGGYSHKKFSQLKEGMNRDEVVALLGTPLTSREERMRDVWTYYKDETKRAVRRGIAGQNHEIVIISSTLYIYFDDTGRSRQIVGQVLPEGELRLGMSKSEVVGAIGPPREKSFTPRGQVHSYSGPGSSLGNYRMRRVRFDEGGRVVKIIKETWYD